MLVPTRSLSLVPLLASGALLASGCLISHRYSTDGVAAIPALGHGQMVVPAALDARDNGRPDPRPTMSGKERERELGEVREAVAEHVTRAGVVSAPWPTAPETPDAVRQVLAAAQHAGIEEVLFVRYHGAVGIERCAMLAPSAAIGLVPWVILQSLPFSRHAATAGFEAFVVSARTGEVLTAPSRLAAYGERINQWGCDREGIMHEMMRRSLHAVLEDVAADRGRGYPRRFMVADVPGFVVAAPEVRAYGGYLQGLGWSLPLPPGWAFDPAIGKGGGARSPAGMTLAAGATWCNRGGHDCGDSIVAQLEGAGTRVLDQQELEMGDRPATDIRAVRPDGSRVLMRVVGAPGVALTMTCEASPNVPDADFQSCRRAFGGAQLSVVTRDR